MRLKSFHARSMSEAMRQVRDTLGEDAIIVNTRQEKSGWVKITAAVEQPPAAPEPPPGRGKKAPYAEPEEGAVEAITAALLRHRVPAGVSEKIIAAAMTLAEPGPQQALAAALQKVFTFETPAKKPKPVVLVGPPGAGKTLMAAKLAARAVLDGRAPAVITTDIARAGGVEQLSSFLQILSLPLQQAEDAKGLKAALAALKPHTEVIVDTGGLNPFDPQEMKALARLLACGDMQPALVLPAGTDAEEAAEIAMTFEVLGVRRLIPTRLDFSRHLGGVLSAAERAGLSFTEASHTPQVANGILQLTPEALASLLMPRTAKKR